MKKIKMFDEKIYWSSSISKTTLKELFAIYVTKNNKAKICIKNIINLVTSNLPV